MHTSFKTPTVLLLLLHIMRAPLYSQICTGVVANTVVATPGLLCPGSTATLGLLNTYTQTGITYQWMMSYLSSVGPFMRLVHMMSKYRSAFVLINQLASGARSFDKT